MEGSGDAEENRQPCEDHFQLLHSSFGLLDRHKMLTLLHTYMAIEVEEVKKEEKKKLSMKKAEEKAKEKNMKI